jgi:hypothetical protein
LLAQTPSTLASTLAFEQFFGMSASDSEHSPMLDDWTLTLGKGTPSNGGSISGDSDWEMLGNGTNPEKLYRPNMDDLPHQIESLGSQPLKAS